MIHQENVINSFLSIPHLSPAQQLPQFPTTATEHCKQPLLAQSITHKAHTFGVWFPPYKEAFILGEIAVGWAEQTSFHLSPLFLTEVWPEERLLDSALPVAWQH